MSFLVLLTLSVATSIDALAVGITLSLLSGAIAAAVIIIGLVTFGFSYAGVHIGKKFGYFFESKIEIIGGLVLIGIGVKILIEHLISSYEPGIEHLPPVVVFPIINLHSSINPDFPNKSVQKSGI